MDPVRKIRVDVYECEHHCGDGCCDLYWKEVAVNGIRLTSPSEDVRYPNNQKFTSGVDPSMLTAILKALYGETVEVAVEIHTE